MKKYKNKYRIPSTRAGWWDYGSAGAYFITICTALKKHFFGAVKEGVMQYNQAGIIADVCWHEIPNHHPMITLGDFVVMPNHIHGILILNNPSPPVQQQPPNIAQQRFQNQGKNTVSSIVGSYKSAVTKHANRLGLENGWQSRFHDHIIRNEKEYQHISDYIVHNPANWPDDKFYSTPS